eukprot:COSAG02_NODE_457_length_21950_cov_35.452794_8_plen_251_part_00
MRSTQCSRRQTLSESVWRRPQSDTWSSRSVRFRAAKCRVSGFAPRNAKCPISRREMRNVRFRAAKCETCEMRNMRNARPYIIHTDPSSYPSRHICSLSACWSDRVVFLVWTFAAHLHFFRHVYNSIQPAAAVARVSRRRADALSWSAAVSRAPAGRPEAGEASQREHCCRRAAQVWTFAARLHFVRHAYNSIQPAAAVARVSRRRADALSWSASRLLVRLASTRIRASSARARARRRPRVAKFCCRRDED